MFHRTRKRMSLLAAAAILTGALSGWADRDASSDVDQAAWQLPAEARQFDFWLGDWNLALGGGGAATNAITSFGIGGGIAILENYAQGTYKGTSVSYYSPRIGKWRQMWLDTQDGLLEFEGAFQNGRMLLEGRVGAARTRLVYLNIAERTLDFKYDVSGNGGVTWTTSFSAHYTRAAGRAEVAPKGVGTTAALPQAARQFDFWLGDWTVTADQGLVGSDAASSFGVGGGYAVLQSLRTPNGYEQSSVSVYHPQDGAWWHISVDSDGKLLDLSGGLRSGTMVLDGELYDLQSGATSRARLSFEPGAGQDFDQVLEVSEDEGQNWQVLRTVRRSRSAVATPGDFRATKVKKKKVVLEWADTSAAEARFEVLRKDGETWTPVETLAPGTTSATVKSLRRRTAYTFAVRACDDSRCSDPAEIAVTTR